MSTPWRLMLPQSLEVGGKEFAIRTDYRAALDICAALSDPDLSDGEKALVCLEIMFLDFESIDPQFHEQALNKCFWFINGGTNTSSATQIKLVDWEQDFHMIVAPINRVTGTDVRGVDYMHWWTFLSAYYEIGDCTFAQIVNIRNKKAKGKKLEKNEQEWYAQNRHLVDMRGKMSQGDIEFFEALSIKKPTP